MRCPKCNEMDHEPDALFCHACGKRLRKNKFMSFFEKHASTIGVFWMWAGLAFIIIGTVGFALNGIFVGAICTIIGISMMGLSAFLLDKFDP